MEQSNKSTSTAEPEKVENLMVLVKAEGYQKFVHEFAELKKQLQAQQQHINNLSAAESTEEQIIVSADQIPALKSVQEAICAKISCIENLVGLKGEAKCGLVEENIWDSNACAAGLTISDDGLGAQYSASFYGYQSVRAKWPISTYSFGICYFEVRFHSPSGAAIGLSTKKMAMEEELCVGEDKGTFAYDSEGTFWGNAIEGCQRDAKGRPFVGGKPKFGVGDTVGCGVHLATRTIFYTKNGHRLDNGDLFVNDNLDLFPAVTLLNPHNSLAARFAPKFEFDIATVTGHDEV